MRLVRFGYGLFLGMGIGMSLLLGRPAAADELEVPLFPPVPVQPAPPALDPVLPPQSCPEEVEPLVAMLVRDLPSYANRVLQRLVLPFDAVERPATVILAGEPEFEPLSTGPGIYYPVPPEETNELLKQVFFTTLEREYFPDGIHDLQYFHWVFLVQTDTGWRLAMMFSSLGGYPDSGPVSPPENTSQGAIARAIRIWLRDCRAGAIAS